MKNRNLKLILGSLFSLLLVLNFQNCAKLDIQNLDRNPASSSLGAADNNDDDAPGTISPVTDPPVVTTPPVVTNPPVVEPPMPPQPVCETQLIDTVRPVKVLFLIDTSGSNATNSKRQGTDDGKVWRLEVLNNFISRYGSKANFHFGLVTFQNSSATAKILVNGQAAITNNLSAIKDGIERFRGTADSGYTPYKAALAAAKNIIADDIKNQSSQTAYAVVMISDGKPTDYKSPSEVTADIKSILAIAPQQISVNSVFYYKSAQTSDQTEYLKAIASSGNGKFVVANSNDTLKIDDVIKVPQVVCK